MSELEERMDSQELTDWIAYDRIAPIDHAERLEIMEARTALCAIAPHMKRRPKLRDFLPNHLRGEVKAQTPEQMMRAMKRYANTHNGSKRGKQ